MTRCLHRGRGGKDLLAQRRKLIARLIELCLGLFERCLVGARVDLEEQIASLHELIVLDRQIDDGTRHAGRDLNHVGPHLPIARPWIHDVVPVLEQHQRDRDEHDRTGR